MTKLSLGIFLCGLSDLYRSQNSHSLVTETLLCEVTVFRKLRRLQTPKEIRPKVMINHRLLSRIMCVVSRKEVKTFKTFSLLTTYQIP